MRRLVALAVLLPAIVLAIAVVRTLRPAGPHASLFEAADLPRLDGGFDRIVRLNEVDKAMLIDWARRGLADAVAGAAAAVTAAGADEAPLGEVVFPDRFDGMGHKVFVAVRTDGLRRGARSAAAANLARAVYVAAARAALDRRGGVLRAEELPRTDVGIQIYGAVTPRATAGFEPGIHGMAVVQGERREAFSSAYAIEGNYSDDKLWRMLCGAAGLADDCADDPATTVLVFPTLHIGSSRYTQAPVTYYRANVVDFSVDVTAGDLGRMQELASGWLAANVQTDGTFHYQYNPSNGRYSTSNNMIRQFMGSRALAELAARAPDRYGDPHRRNLSGALAQWLRWDGDRAYVWYRDKSKLGAMATAVRALAHSPFYADYATHAAALGRTMTDLLQADGAFWPWFVEPDYDYDADYLLTFYSGEAILALVELYEASGDAQWLDAAQRAADFYRVRYAVEIDAYYYPAYVPWHTMAWAKVHRYRPDPRLVAGIFTMNDRLLTMQNDDGRPWPDLAGRFYNPATPQYGTPHSASDGVYVDGLVWAWALAREVGDAARERRYGRALQLGLHNLKNLQYDGADMYFLSHPERVIGALRYRVDDNRIRVDTTQHTLDALLRLDDELNGVPASAAPLAARQRGVAPAAAGVAATAAVD